MKSLYYSILFCFCCLAGCNNQASTSHESKTSSSPQTEENSSTDLKEITPILQEVLEQADVEGSILIYDSAAKTYYSNDFDRCDRGFLPASTFKVPNSIIALETGVIENDSTLFKWDGKKRRLPSWERDLIFKEAFHVSCVPCYQEIARKIGVERMKSHLQKFNYGNIVLDSSSIDLFWLEGESKITQFQQTDFFSRFYNSKLPIATRTTEIMKRLMIIDDNEHYKLSGKTGWSIRNGNNVGWFVGYLETKEKYYFFATNVEPNESFDMKLFPKIRNEVTLKGFKALRLIP